MDSKKHVTNGKNNPLTRGLVNFLNYVNEFEIKAEKRGRKRKISNYQILLGLLYHKCQRPNSGTLSEHTRQITGICIADSSICERRQSMELEIFDTIANETLKPIAEKNSHPDCFYKGFRLLGIDGSDSYLRNSKNLSSKLKKHRGGGKKGRIYESSFFQQRWSSLVEIGCHNPIAVSISTQLQEVELTLSKSLYSKVPAKSLLLLDALYGQGKTCSLILEQLKKHNSHILVCLNSSQGLVEQKKLSDGSRIVRLSTPSDSSSAQRGLVMRQISFKIEYPNGTKKQISLLTDLLDEKKYPAKELAQLFIKRWEQEIFYYELKVVLNDNDLLQSQRVETAYQEVIALFLVGGFMAQQRLKIASKQADEVLQLSYRKTLTMINSFWTVLNAAGNVLSQRQQSRLIEQMSKEINLLANRPRRKRSCPRVCRKSPHQKVARSYVQPSSYGPTTITMIAI